MAPLGDAAKAALRAELQGRHGRHVLHRERIVDALVTYCGGRGESVADLPFDVDNDDEQAWEKEWRTLASSASI